MNAERWQQVDRLLHEVLERPSAERRNFLRSVCAGDESLEHEVWSLVTADEAAGTFLDSPAQRTISHYRIVEVLGAGGMGVVYKAVDTRLNRVVALKMLPDHLRDDQDLNRRLVAE